MLHFQFNAPDMGTDAGNTEHRIFAQMHVPKLGWTLLYFYFIIFIAICDSPNFSATECSQMTKLRCMSINPKFLFFILLKLRAAKIFAALENTSAAGGWLS